MCLQDFFTETLHAVWLIFPLFPRLVLAKMPYCKILLQPTTGSLGLDCHSECTQTITHHAWPTNRHPTLHSSDQIHTDHCRLWYISGPCGALKHKCGEGAIYRAEKKSNIVQISLGSPRPFPLKLIGSILPPWSAGSWISSSNYLPSSCSCHKLMGTVG